MGLEVACAGKRATRVLHRARVYEEPRHEALAQLTNRREKLEYPGSMALRQIEAFRVPPVRQLRGADLPLPPTMGSPAWLLVACAHPLHRCRHLEFVEWLLVGSSMIALRRCSALHCSVA